MLAIFVPLFFSAISNANICIKWLSILPLIAMLISVILMLIVLKPRYIYNGFNINELDELANKSNEDILKFEIGANSSAYKENKVIVKKQQNLFTFGLYSAVFAIFASMILLFINQLSVIFLT